ncbi:amino acid permease [Acidianus brierleyi]|uniref:APC family permease n=2 Tax=Acidianus brierleyi TaxID=41673 RepID=A0A2U9IJ65_9CREN|nr:amino acid permease [Acidianus brierleyi]
MEEHTLKKGEVGLWHGVFQSFSFVAPAGDVAILLVGTVAFAGEYTAISVLLAWLIYGLFMITPYEFSKIKANAGSYYAYSAEGAKWLAPIALFSWMGENLTGPAFSLLGLSGFIFLLSSTLSSIPFLWIVFLIIVGIYMGLLPYLGIKPSLNYVMYTGFAEALFLMLSSIIIIIKLGSSNTIIPFTISIPYIPAIFFGAIFSILDFTGLGTVTTISEEIKESKKVVKKALIYAYVLSGISLILPAYALTVGWGLSKISSYAISPDPGLIVFKQFLGIVGFALLAAFTINSYLSYSVAKTNADSRIWFSAARDGIILPKWIAYVHPKYKTPSHAIIFWLGLSVIVSLIFGILFGPVNGGLVLLDMAGVAILSVHIVTNSALSIYKRRSSHHYSIIEIAKYFLAPSMASILGITIIYFSLQSTIAQVISQPTPLNFAYFGATLGGVLWCLVGFIISFYYIRKKPDILAKAGNYDAEGELK